MKTQEALSTCEETVRRFDPDRYFASLFAPASVRPLLFALYAFNHEIARAGEVREPMMGAIRLQWWREAVAETRAGRPREHPAAIGLAELFAGVPRAEPLFHSLLEAREFDTGIDTFADSFAFEAYCAATSGSLMAIAALAMGSEADGAEFFRHAGIAYATAGLLRAIPFHAARRRIYLPLDLLHAESISIEDVFAGRNTPPLKRVMRSLSDRAREHLVSARASSPDTTHLIAALAAALAPLYLNRVTRAKFNPFRDTSEIALFRRQWALLRAATLRRL